MLDPTSKNKIYNILQELKQTGITIIYITNFIDEILLSDRTIIFENGKIKKDFLKKDLLKNIDYLDSKEYPGIISLLACLHKSGIDITLENLKIEELTQKLLNIKNTKI